MWPHDAATREAAQPPGTRDLPARPISPTVLIAARRPSVERSGARAMPAPPDVRRAPPLPPIGRPPGRGGQGERALTMTTTPSCSG